MGSGAMYAKNARPPTDRELVADEPPPAAHAFDRVGDGTPDDGAQDRRLRTDVVGVALEQRLGRHGVHVRRIMPDVRALVGIGRTRMAAGRCPTAIVCASALEVRRCCKQHGYHRTEGHGRAGDIAHTRGDQDLHGPPPVSAARLPA